VKKRYRKEAKVRDIKNLREISARLKELGIPSESLNALDDKINNIEREQLLAQGLADIASNFGCGTFSSSLSFKVEQEFRDFASKTLKEAGYIYCEYPAVPPDADGWYSPTERCFKEDLNEPKSSRSKG